MHSRLTVNPYAKKHPKNTETVRVLKFIHAHSHLNNFSFSHFHREARTVTGNGNVLEKAECALHSTQKNSEQLYSSEERSHH